MKYGKFKAGLFFSITVASGAFGDQFDSSENGYTLSIPDDWIRIPQDLLQAMQSKLTKPGTKSPWHYEAGFQLRSAEQWFTYPYVLIQVQPYAEAGLNRQIYESEIPQLINRLTGTDLQMEVKKQASDEVSSVLGKATVEAVEYDSFEHRFIWNMTMDVAGAGSVRGEITGYFGRRAMIQVNFCSLDSEWEKQSPIGRQIADSFNFHPPDAYDLASASPAGPLARVMSAPAWLRGAIIGGFAGMVVGGLAKLRKRNKSRA